MRYCQSKFGTLVLSNELAKRHGGKRFTATSYNAGSVQTRIHTTLYWFQRWPLLLTHFDAAHGALTPLWPATSPETANMGGEYLVPWAKTRDPALGKKFWSWCEAEVKNL